MKKHGAKVIIKFSTSIILGLIITFIYGVILLDFLFHDPYGAYEKIDILHFILASIIYISIVLFFIFWIRLKSKVIYLLLLIPIICIIAGVINTRHKNYVFNKEYMIKFNEYTEYQKSIENIPEVNEYNASIYQYRPFSYGNLLAKLDEKSNYKITKNLPVLDGATAFYPVYASFVQAVYPPIYRYDSSEGILHCSRTEEAFEYLLDGKTDIIFCLEPSDIHIKRFSEKELDLKLIPIGREAFVFFVHNENPVNNLTIENIRGIYSGKIINWEEINGINQDIMAFQRPKNSGSQTILEKVMGDISITEPRMEYVIYEMGEIINKVADYKNFPNALGYSFLIYSTEMVTNNQIKLLSVDGIFPSNKTIQNGSYPFTENFYAIYIDSENKNENIESFIEWILSDQGQELIAKTGYIPIAKQTTPSAN